MGGWRSPFFIGIDVGTQGTRMVCLDRKGQLIEKAETAFPLSPSSRRQQDPEMWWQVIQQTLAQLIQKLQAEISIDAIKALSVTSTSGTMIPLDQNNRPLHHAIMYSDDRQKEEGRGLQHLFSNKERTYKGFNASSGLSKIVWFSNRYPEKTEKIRRWVHAADFVIGRLTGRWGMTDQTNSLKTGYDLAKDEWPKDIFSALSLDLSWFPDVLTSGTPIGAVSAEVAQATGISESTIVTAGMTDGCASQVSSGAVCPGRWNTTIGTTLVIKGVTENPISDPSRVLYNHRHPEGYWMPGGASNIGADWVTSDFPGENLDDLNEKAARLIPTNHMAYPLKQKGERFPFMSPEARGFVPAHVSAIERYTACMEGVAYIERYAYERIESLSGETVRAVYTAGGGSSSTTWLNIRSQVLDKPVYKMKYATGAVGAAILAASRTLFSSLSVAAQEMITEDAVVEPDEGLVKAYDERYHTFIDRLASKGYIRQGTVT
ncbi:carbohydrate kinase [Sporolactobacillus sp. THM7-7]|nr:carbohydrate kinase [Sporolactobacillus sp. THM7-7]